MTIKKINEFLLKLLSLFLVFFPHHAHVNFNPSRLLLKRQFNPVFHLSQVFFLLSKRKTVNGYFHFCHTLYKRLREEKSV